MKAAPAGARQMERPASAGLIGSTSLMFTGKNEAMTGCVLAKDAWGQGLATEALRAMVDLAESLGVRRIPVLAVFPNLAPGVRQRTLCFARQP